VLCVFASCLPGRVLAFSDPETFRNDVAEGGGGGRFFTGSPADGYTCKVCHSGGQSVDVQVSGLPLDGYTPGNAYEITIDWADELENVALALELNDGRATAAGAMHLPPRSELYEPERCVPVGAEIPAGILLDAPNRTILEVANCGARRVRFLWTAPAEDRGAVWFAGSLVRADGNADVGGDGVTNFTAVLPSPSQSREDARAIGAGCSVAHASERCGSHAAALAWLALGALMYRRRQARLHARRT
jgi:hypothetical protein